MDARTRFPRFFPTLLPVAAIALAASLLLTVWFVWFATVCLSTDSLGVWFAAAAAGLVTGRILVRRALPRTLMPFIPAATAGLLAGLPFLTETAFTIAVSSPGGQPLFWFTAALPVFLTALAAQQVLKLAGPETDRRILTGTAAAAAAVVLQAWMPMPIWLPGLILAVAFSLILTRAVSSEPSMNSANSSADRRSGPFTRTVQPAALCAGWALAGGTFIINHLFTVSLTSVAAGLVFTCGLLSVAAWTLRRLPLRPAAVWAVAVLILAALPWGFSPAVDWILTTSAGFPSGRIVTGREGLLLAVWFTAVLCAFLAGHVLNGRRLSSPGDILSSVLAGCAAVCGGIFLGVSATWMTMAGVLSLAGTPVLERLLSEKVSGRRHLSAAGVLLAAAVSLVSAQPDLARPARILFTERPVLAMHRGVSPGMIPETDAVRLLHAEEGSIGTVTIWKTRPTERELRVNGHRLGMRSTDPDIVPQPASIIATGVLPLVLHPHPGRVLLFNDASGLLREVAEGFPVHTILITPPEAALPSSDLSELTVPLRGRPEEIVRDSSCSPVDVIVDGLVDPARPSSVSRLTRNWYTAVRRRLNADGIFCQRVRCRPAGMDVLRQIAATAATAFDQLILVRLTSHEAALIAAAGDHPLSDRGILSRLQRQHVRRQLGRCGWDWCQMAALPILIPSQAAGPWSSDHLPRPADAGHGFWALSMLRRAARPTLPGDPLYAAFVQQEQRLAEAVPRSRDHDEFRRRMSAYAQQVEIAEAFPDQWWSYRRSLKSEMLRNARPPQETFADGDVQQTIHPLDQLRKDYLSTLGHLIRTVKSGQATPTALQALMAFAADYEPLITDYLHYELVRLHELADHPDPAQELRHRLHTVYFSPPGDQSVRNITAALEQLVRQPELIPDEADRYDLLNDLIQQLIVRWERRTAYEPSSTIRAQRDVDLSVQAVRRALQQMEDLADAAGLEREQFLQRRQFVSDALVVPLRQYGTQIASLRRQDEPDVVLDDVLIESDSDETVLGN